MNSSTTSNFVTLISFNTHKCSVCCFWVTCCVMQALPQIPHLASLDSQLLANFLAISNVTQAKVLKDLVGN